MHPRRDVAFASRRYACSEVARPAWPHKTRPALTVAESYGLNVGCLTDCLGAQTSVPGCSALETQICRMIAAGYPERCKTRTNDRGGPDAVTSYMNPHLALF